MSSSAAEGAPIRSPQENQESQQEREGSSPSMVRPPQQTSSPRTRIKRKRWTLDDPGQNQLAQVDKRKEQLELELFSSSQELARFGLTVADMLLRVPEQHRPQAMFDVYKLLFERQQMYRLTSKSV